MNSFIDSIKHKPSLLPFLYMSPHLCKITSIKDQFETQKIKEQDQTCRMLQSEMYGCKSKEHDQNSQYDDEDQNQLPGQVDIGS